MRKSDKASGWVVYRSSIHLKHAAVNAVCEQSEWDAMVQAQPGFYKLIRSGIKSEAEAERLARGTSGDPKIRLHLR